MPKTSDMIPSRFLKQGDIIPDKLLTIDKIVHEEVGRGEDAAMKWVCYFKEIKKCLSLNATNIKRMEKIFASDDTDEWISKQIVVYWDDEVQFGSELTGGVRVRAPKTPTSSAPLPF